MEHMIYHDFCDLYHDLSTKPPLRPNEDIKTLPVTKMTSVDTPRMISQGQHSQWILSLAPPSKEGTWPWKIIPFLIRVQKVPSFCVSEAGNNTWNTEQKGTRRNKH